MDILSAHAEALVIDFGFLEQLKALPPDRHDRFQRVVSRLLSGEVLAAGNNPLAGPDPDWRFLERHLTLVDAYLRVAGWLVDFMPTYRVARAVHCGGSHRVRFTLLESLLACILRQVYHEQMAGGGREATCEVSAGDLRERIAVAQKSSVPQTRKNIAGALRRLQRFGLVSVEWGFVAEDEQIITVQPLIEAVLSDEEVHAFFEKYAKSAALGEAVEEDEGVLVDEETEESASV
jgi:hypothetical protein